MARGQEGFTVVVKRPKRRLPGQSEKPASSWMKRAGLDPNAPLPERCAETAGPTARHVRALAEKMFAVPALAGPRILPVVQRVAADRERETDGAEVAAPMPGPAAAPLPDADDDRAEAFGENEAFPEVSDDVEAVLAEAPAFKPRKRRWIWRSDHIELPFGQRWKQRLPAILRFDEVPYWATISRTPKRKPRS